MIREKIVHHSLPVEQASVGRDLAVLHSRLDESAFAGLFSEGSRMSIDQAVTLALEK